VLGTNTASLGGPREEGSITIKNSCCHSIIAVSLGSAQRMMANDNFTAKNTDTHLFPPKCLEKRKMGANFVNIIKVLLANKNPAP
jgi:hypothetical protein